MEDSGAGLSLSLSLFLLLGPGVGPHFLFLGLGFPCILLQTKKGTLFLPRLLRGLVSLRSVLGGGGPNFQDLSADEARQGLSLGFRISGFRVWGLGRNDWWGREGEVPRILGAFPIVRVLSMYSGRKMHIAVNPRPFEDLWRGPD